MSTYQPYWNGVVNIVLYAILISLLGSENNSDLLPGGMATSMGLKMKRLRGNH